MKAAGDCTQPLQSGFLHGLGAQFRGQDVGAYNPRLAFFPLTDLT